MADVTIHREQPMAFFKTRVEEALDHQGVEASDDSAFYLVSLLDGFVCPKGGYGDVGPHPEHPLGELLLLALHQRGARRFAMLKLAGDLSLFLSGFFAASLERRRVDLRYYIHVGESAYGNAAADCYPRSGAPLFEELSARFVQLSNVLHRVAETCGGGDPTNLLRLYERWLVTGDGRTAETLERRGVPTVATSGSVH
ncbi:MAG: hypothetical protein AAGN66_03725 [Acidobacteriota bacterium]